MNEDRINHSIAVARKMVEIDTEYSSLYLDILNQADMQIDKYGNDVGYDKRLEDIKSRYGENSDVYDKCHKLINRLKKL